jgi:hypothetical protein
MTLTMKILFTSLALSFCLSNILSAQNIAFYDFEEGTEGFTHKNNVIGNEPVCGIWYGDSTAFSSSAYAFSEHSKFVGFNIESGCGEYVSGLHMLKKEIEITQNYKDVTISFDYCYFPDLLNWEPFSNQMKVVGATFGFLNGMWANEWIELLPNSKWERAEFTIGQSTGDNIVIGPYDLEFYFGKSAIAFDNISIDAGPTSAEQFESTSEISFYPNPATGDLLHISNYKGMGGDFFILNTQGIKVSSGKVRADDTIEITHLAPGVYLVRVAENDRVVSKTILIQ